MADIYKSAGILIKDRKFLVTRSKGKTFFISPGGKIEEGENSKSALIRELSEELSIIVDENDLRDFGVFEAQAQGQEQKKIHMDVFLVHVWQGEVQPSNEVEEVTWINSNIPEGFELGSIFKHDVLPKLKGLDLID